MPVDPFRVPCAYCKDRYPESMKSHYPNVKNPVACSGCGLLVDGEIWAKSGINALVGSFLREGIHFQKTQVPLPSLKQEFKWVWIWFDTSNEEEDVGNYGASFDSLDEAVLDAWKNFEKC